MVTKIKTPSGTSIYETDNLYSAVNVYMDLENKINKSNKKIIRVMLTFDNYCVSNNNSIQNEDYDYTITIKNDDMTYTDVYTTKVYVDALKIYRLLVELSKITKE